MRPFSRRCPTVAGRGSSHCSCWMFSAPSFRSSSYTLYQRPTFQRSRGGTPIQSPNHKPGLITFIIWSSVFWGVLAGSIYGLMEGSPLLPDWWWVIFGSLTASIPLGIGGAVGASRDLPRPVRVAAWGILLAGMALVLLTCNCRREDLAIASQLLVLLLAIPILVGGLSWMRKGREAKTAWMWDCALGASLLVVILGGWYWFVQEVTVPHMVRMAEDKWAEIGRPMPEFERQLKQVEENDSLRALAKDLEPFGIKDLYQKSASQTDLNSFHSTPGFLWVLNSYLGQHEGDQLRLDPPPAKEYCSQAQYEEELRYFAEHAKDFQRLYQGVLHREIPVWGYHPAEFEGPTPDYAMARNLAQLITVDACMKLQRSDTEGAMIAAAALQRMFRSWSEEPRMASFKAYVGFNSLIQGDVCQRLPGNAGPLKALEVESRREHLLRCIQTEAWRKVQAIQKNCSDMGTLQLLDPLGLRPSMAKWISLPWMRLAAAKEPLLAAQQAQILSRSHESAADDLGKWEIKLLEKKDPSVASPDYLRTEVRANLGLVLQEQTGILQAVRALIAAGKTGPLGEWDSVVVPGSKWTVTEDVARGSVTFRLSPMPSWMLQKEFSDETFWSIQPDGSRPWQLSVAAAQ